MLLCSGLLDNRVFSLAALGLVLALLFYLSYPRRPFGISDGPRNHPSEGIKLLDPGADSAVRRYSNGGERSG